MSEIVYTGTVIPEIPPQVPPELVQLTAAWLLAQRSQHTREAYRRDVTDAPERMKVPGWLPWCHQHGVDALRATRGHVDAYGRQLDAAGSSPATVARKLSAISSWYDYLLDEEAVDRNPAKRATRPEIDRDVSNSTGMTQDEAIALTHAADRDGRLAGAIVRLMLFGGVRVAVVLNARWRDFGYDSGHRVIRFALKGGRTRKAPLPPPAADALAAWIAYRGEPGPDDNVFIIDGAPIDRPTLYRMIRRLARQAGIPSWANLTPHSLRHTFATLALDADVPLADVQDAMGHKDPRTTQRYNRARHRLERHPGYTLAAKLTTGDPDA